MRRIFTSIPFTIYGITFLVGFACLMLVPDGRFDKGSGTGLMIYLFGMVLFGFPFYLAFEFLFAINNGQAFVPMEPLIAIIGLFICIASDILLGCYRSWRRCKLKARVAH